MSATDIVNSLAGLLIFTSLLVIETKRPSRAALLYGVQSLVLVAIFALLAHMTDSTELYLWAASSMVTKVILVPAILYLALRRFDTVQTLPSLLRVAAVVVLAAAVVVLCALIVASIKLPMMGAFRPTLTVSLAHFFLGIACIVTQRNIIKQIFGYCLMENGSHLTLALLANQAPELVEIGIATDAVFAVVIFTVLARRIQRTFHSLDSDDMMTLRG
jgi:hydrogenase-4 component E